MINQVSIRHIIFVLLLCVGGISLSGQDTSLVIVDSALVANRGVVRLGSDTLFFLYESSAAISAKERASLANQRIAGIAEKVNFNADKLHIKDTLDGSFVVYDSLYLVKITMLDANGAGLDNRRQQAKNALKAIEEGVKRNHATTGFRGLIREIGIASLVVVIFFIVVFLTNRLFRYVTLRVRKSHSRYLEGLKIRKYEIIARERMHSLIIFLLNVFRFLFLLIVFYITLPLVLNLFPWTQGVAEMLIDFVLDPLKDIIAGIVAFIPNLFTIALIFIVVRFFVRGITHLARDIKAEKLNLPGFYPDWALPTARLINLILYAFMFVVIWPYLPGSDSPAFKGITVFLGLLVTLGSSSAVANAVSGLVITYMRPYQVGHRIKIGEVSGDVVEKNLLVTRIKTTKNEIITVPNSKVMAGESINYSMSSDLSGGLIINTEVTIGYDVNWRTVHRLLKTAAAKTPLIKEDPPPFVLQTGLDDFYVRYQINAYTESPQDQPGIYSDLHALIQDEFAKAGVEIMSPHYRANREGESTIPEAPENKLESKDPKE
jgi:small-conductance mechanosensitive channel